jgi:hypothetical protein
MRQSYLARPLAEVEEESALVRYSAQTLVVQEKMSLGEFLTYLLFEADRKEAASSRPSANKTYLLQEAARFRKWAIELRFWGIEPEPIEWTPEEN